MCVWLEWICVFIITRMEAFNLLTTIYDGIQSGFSSGSLAIVNHLLQAYFFSIALSNIVAMILKAVHFAYAGVIADSWAVKIAGVGMMWYLKIWNHYSGILYIGSVFTMGIVSLYVYDCCGNISEHFDNWRLNNRDWAIMGSFALMFTSTAYIFYSVHKDTQNPLKYEYSGIYLMVVIVVLIGNMLRRRSVIYTLVGVLTMNYLIGSRYYLSNIIDQHLIALATAPYFMMAFQAEFAERKNIQAETYSNFFRASAALAAFSLLNDGYFPLELLLGGGFILGIIVNR